MASSIPLQVAETIQTAHINKDPSAEHDINPSTATSKREPVILEKQETQPEGQPLSSQEEEAGESSETTTSTKTSRQQQHTTLFQQSLHSHSRTIPTPGGFDEEEEDMGDEIDIDEDEEDQEEEGHIPFSIIRAKPRGAGVGPSRKHHLTPIPDLRYEQSYLHSIRDADTWWKVVLITARDQVMMPFAQGILYNLAICGWQFWNRNARVHGSSVGARLRRWWYGVNNWPIPPAPAGTPSRSSVFKGNFSNSRFGK